MTCRSHVTRSFWNFVFDRNQQPLSVSPNFPPLTRWPLSWCGCPPHYALVDTVSLAIHCMSYRRRRIKFQLVLLAVTHIIKQISTDSLWTSIERLGTAYPLCRCIYVFRYLTNLLSEYPLLVKYRYLHRYLKFVTALV